MNLVQPALRRPLTIVVAVIAVALGSLLALRQMPRDIFPTLGIPTIYVAQPFGGMDPAQMEGYLTYYYEYHFLYITGIEHVESKSIQGASIIKLQFVATRQNTLGVALSSPACQTPRDESAPHHHRAAVAGLVATGLLARIAGVGGLHPRTSCRSRRRFERFARARHRQP